MDDNPEQHVLVIDDDPDILTAARLLLKRHFTSVTLCATPEEIPVIMGRKTFDVILLDMNFGPGESTGEQGFHWLSQILQLDAEAVVIMITAHGGVDVAVEAMKQGATDFIAKPWHNQKVVATVNAAKKLRRSQLQLKKVTASHQALVNETVKVPGSDAPILGSSTGLKQVLNVLSRAAPTDANVLILGENGTGKELIARELHRQSHRRDQVFMSVDVGALSDTLFESELFGHRKGAFTGAGSDRMGRILAADGGTLFLDEIGNLPLHLQAKLLTVLAQRKVTPLGDDTSKDFDVRIVAATNVPKRRLMDEQYFRQDLLFRLNTVELELPPLRDRKDDILPIAEHYLSYYARKYHKDTPSLSEAARQAVLQSDWPGNIRGLRHAVERAVILADGGVLMPADFQLDALVSDVPEHSQSEGPAEIAEGAAPEDFNLERIEKDAISQALRIHKYNISHAAKALGLTRAALYRRMEKHGL